MPDIYVIGYPKTGTTWLCRLLGDYLNSPAGNIYKPSSPGGIAAEGADRPGKYYIGHGHPVPIHEGHDEPVSKTFVRINVDALTTEKIVLMGRDPRDVAVSAMHYWKMGLDDVIDCMATGRWPLSHGKGWNRFYYQWYKSFSVKPFIIMSYEALLNDTNDRLRWLLFSMGIEVDDRRVDEAVLRQSFDERKRWTEKSGDELNYGKEFQLRFLRSGKAGVWQDHFNVEQEEVAKEFIWWRRWTF